jgi:hypothetical protein
MVGFEPIQRSSLVYCQFASVGMRDVVGGATKEANGRGVPSEMLVHENLRCHQCRWLGKQWWMDGHERHVWWCLLLWRWKIGKGCLHFWVCVWSLGDKIGGWISSHGCNREISLSEEEWTRRSASPLLRSLASCLAKNSDSFDDLFLWFENICLTN